LDRDGACAGGGCSEPCRRESPADLPLRGDLRFTRWHEGPLFSFALLCRRAWYSHAPPSPPIVAGWPYIYSAERRNDLVLRKPARDKTCIAAAEPRVRPGQYVRESLLAHGGGSGRRIAGYNSDVEVTPDWVDYPKAGRIIPNKRKTCNPAIPRYATKNAVPAVRSRFGLPCRSGGCGFESRRPRSPSLL